MILLFYKRLVEPGGAERLLINQYKELKKLDIDAKIVTRSIAPHEFFKDIQSESITNSSLKRPLSAEPIIRAALILIKLNEEKLIPIKEICEILLFNNWIDSTTFISRQYLAHQISGTKKKFISLFDLQDLL